MSTNLVDASLTQTRDIIARLQLPIPDLPTLLSLLCSPLNTLRLLPPQFRKYSNGDSVPAGALTLSRHIPSLQRALLEHIAPTWESALVQEKKELLLTQYFCPDSFAFTSTAAGDIALLAYSSILSLPLTKYSFRLLARLSNEYPVDRLYAAIFSNVGSSQRQSVAWDDCLRNIAAVPAKVANAAGTDLHIPPELEQKRYFDNVSLRCEFMVFTFSSAPSQEKTASLGYLLTKLVNVGVFPPSPSSSISQPSFWNSTLPTIRRRLSSVDHASYSVLFSDVIQGIPSTLTQQSIISSLLASMSRLRSNLDPSAASRAFVKREAVLLRGILGTLNPRSLELWENIFAVILNRQWDESFGRIFVCWAAGADEDAVNAEALKILLAKILDVWSSPEHVKHSLLTQHQYLTALLLITISYFPPSASQITSLALSPVFISGIGRYINHFDRSVRRCGMLTAEIIAHRADKKLDFGDWAGNDTEKPWARELRSLITKRDIDADIGIAGDPSEESTPQTSEMVNDSVELITDAARQHVESMKASKSKPVAVNAGYDSDDSLTGYASPSSSRSTSPTPSELEEIEHDPTLRVGVKKVPRPVYLVQLGELVRNTSGLKSDEADQEADKLEMALNYGEELVRKKQGYGVELDENAVNLVYGFIGLHDNFDLEGFDVKRQSVLNALVACCPRKAALSVIEEFFKNQYSTGQRYVMLNALALGARELASLPIPPPFNQSPNNNWTSFPSKVLPAALHRKYLAASNQGTDSVQRLLDGISREAIDRGREVSADKVPNLVRERHLRIRKPVNISEMPSMNLADRGVLTSQISQPKTTFTDVAAEFFIAPLINRFWLFLRNEQTREARTAQHEPLYRYKGAGSGLILNPIVLTHFLSTLAVLMHAAQNALQWLAILAPDALELAITLGTRPVSQADSNDDNDERPEEQMNEGDVKQASVLTTALELALVVLDGCLELDGGRSLGLEHTAMLLGAGEWAGEVFSRLEKGVRVEGGGGAQEVRLKRAAAGVLLKVDELTSKWRRSMVDVR